MSTGVSVRKSQAEAGGAALPRGAIMALVLLTLLNLVNYVDRYVLAGVQPLVQTEFGIGDEKAGALTSAFFLTYMLVAPLTGWLGDRLPRKPLLVAGALLWSAATLLTAWVHNYAELYFRHAIVGIGEATFCIFAPAMLADFYPETERNRILSIFYTTIPVGAALGYLLGGTLGGRYGWRTPFFVAALPGLAAALLFGLLVREPVRGAADKLTYKGDSADGSYAQTVIRGLASSPGYWAATLGMAATVFSMGGISAFLPTFFVRFGGMSLGRAGLTVGGITAITGLLGTAVGGWVAQRWLRTDHRALFWVSAISALLAIPGGLAAFFGPHWMMIPGAFVAEFFLFLGTGPLNTAIVNAIGARIRSFAIALELFLIHALGDWPSPKLIGRISDHTSLRVGLGATLVTFAFASIILFFGARFAPRLWDSGGTAG